MLQRLALRELVEWRQRADCKPLLIDGARQVGKSWLVGKLFGPQEFRRVHWLDVVRRRAPRRRGVGSGTSQAAVLATRPIVASVARIATNRASS